MGIHRIYTNSNYRNFNYLIEMNEKELICIDPLAVDMCLAKAKELGKSISVIINTHEHFDHISGNAALSKETGAKVWAHKSAQGKIENIDHFIEHGDVIPFVGGELQVLFTPGHTMAHVCLLAPGQFLVAGDTFFNAGVGNCHNGGHPKDLFATFETMLKDLADETKIYPGHDYLKNNLQFTLSIEPGNIAAKDLLNNIQEGDLAPVTTMELEKKINLFLRLDEKSVIDGLDGDFKTREDVFLKLREKRNKW